MMQKRRYLKMNKFQVKWRSGAVYTDVLKDCEFQQNTSVNGIQSPPSYVEITKKKPVDSSSSSDEDSIEKTSKKVGNSEKMLEKKRRRG